MTKPKAPTHEHAGHHEPAKKQATRAGHHTHDAEHYAHGHHVEHHHHVHVHVHHYHGHDPQYGQE